MKKDMTEEVSSNGITVGELSHLKNEVVNKISNMTCVLQEVGFLNDKKELDLKHLRQHIIDVSRRQAL